ncbi:MAG: YwiC-like family protein [Arachnia sp.]
MTATATPRAARSRRGAHGWVLNQHGAWAMVLVPWLLGFATVVRDGGHPAPGLVLLACWLAGYFLSSPPRSGSGRGSSRATCPRSARTPS